MAGTPSPFRAGFLALLSLMSVNVFAETATFSLDEIVRPPFNPVCPETVQFRDGNATLTLSGGGLITGSPNLGNPTTIYVGSSISGCGGAIRLSFNPPAANPAFTLAVPSFWRDRYLITATFALSSATHIQTVELDGASQASREVTVPLSNVQSISVAPLQQRGLFGWIHYIDDVSFEYEPANAGGTFDFEIAAGTPEQPRRVLIHKYGPEEAYPSPWQQQDHSIEIEGTALSAGNAPIAGATVYFRVIDPPDKSPYIPVASQTNGDNAGPPGTLSAASAVCDGSGKARTTLRITDRYAGDNYQIEASLDPNFSCASTSAGCARTGILTAWKREYMETDRMFRRGAYLTKDFPAGSDFVEVSDLSQFQSGDLVRFIHAPRLQLSPAAAGGLFPAPAATEFFYSEDHVVDVVTTATVMPDGTIRPPRLQLRAGDTLGAPYGVDRSFTTPSPTSAPIAYLRDGAGVVNAGFYEPDLALIASAYASMYVEVVPASNTVPELPFEPQMSWTLGMFIANRWFENGQRTATPAVTPLSNHVQIAGGSRIPDILNPVTGSYGAELGFTPAGSGHHRSWIWARRIELAVLEAAQPVFSLPSNTVNAEVALHESVHQWQVNPPPSPPGVQVGHCVFQRYQKDNRYCHMHAPFYDPAHNPELGDGIADFHYEVDGAGNVHSEYTHIRRHPEPFVQ